jgi:cytoskeletal protein RodZ
MHKKRLSAFLLGSTAWLLVACQNPATDTTATEAATSTSQVQSDTQATNQAASRASSLEATESVQAQTPSASSTTTDSATTNDAAQTADEATLITEAKQTITQLTGYVESDVYLFIVESVEANEVTINVRENGSDVASSVGFYRYNGTTGELLEMDIVTGEYTRHPAQY